MLRKFRGAAFAGAVAVIVAGSGAGAAQARVEVTDLVAKPIPTGAQCSLSQTQIAPQAGQASDFCVALSLSPGAGGYAFGDDARDLKISLPPGQSGAATATPLCTTSQFKSTRGCPKNTQVGVVRAAAESLVNLNESLLSGKIYNVQPSGPEPAALGVQIDVGRAPLQLPGVIKLLSPVNLRAEDGGLDSVVLNTPRSFMGLPLTMRRFALTLWGPDTADRDLQRPFMQTVPYCDQDAVSVVSVLSYRGDTTKRSTSFRANDCETLEFTPTTTVSSSVRSPDVPADYNVVVNIPASSNAVPRMQGLARDTTIILPVGQELTPILGSRPEGLAGCTSEQLGFGKQAPATCPANSQIGEVILTSPLLSVPEIRGKIFVRQPEPGGPQIGYYVVAEQSPHPDALRVKLRVGASVNPENGQVTVALNDITRTPFTQLKYTYFGGPYATLATPRECGTYITVSEFETYHGTNYRNESPMVIDQDCDSTSAFEPTFSASVGSTDASQDTLLTTTLSRPQGHARIAGAKIDLPAGLTGRLTAAEQCPLKVAATGDCPPETRIGTVEAFAGPGPAPLGLSGQVFLTEGENGDLAGLAIVVETQVGPINFGRNITLSPIQVREDLGLTLSIPSIPLRQRGVEANIRKFVVRIEKSGFAINSSSCAAKEFTATLTSDTGKVAKLTSPYQATGCDKLTFAPKLTAAFTGDPVETKLDGHPPMKITLTQQPGEARASSTSVTLPKTLSVDSNRLQGLCQLAQYEAGNCPESAVKGTVVASTPLLPSTLSGPITFVQVPGAALPDLRIDLRGALAVSLKGSVAFGEGNRLVTNVDPVPDTPLASFEFNLKGGAEGVLIANTDLCQAASNALNIKATSHAGTTYTQNAEPAIAGCGPAATLRVGSLRKGKPTMDLRVSGVRTPVSTTSLRLPSGLAFAKASQLRRLVKVSARGLKKGSRATVRVSGRTLRVSVPRGQTAAVLRVTLRSGGVRASARLRKAGRPRLSFAFSATTAANNKAIRSTLRIRPAR